MKIEVLRNKIDPDKYFTPGVHVMIDPEEYPGVVDKLNEIIDWDSSDFPIDPKTRREVKKDVTEMMEKILDKLTHQFAQDPTFNVDEFVKSILNKSITIDGLTLNQIEFENDKFTASVVEYDQLRDFLGPDPQLTPGIVFKWNNGEQTFAVANYNGTPTLALYNTVTGQRALNRFVKEYLLPEYVFEHNIGMIEFNISDVEFQSLEDCLLLQATEGEDLETYISQPGLFKGVKLDSGNFRFFLKQFEGIKYELVHKKSILHIVCSPLFETADLWIDGNGTIVFNVGEFQDLVGIGEKELFDYLLPELSHYFKIYQSKVPQLPTPEKEE